MTYAKFVAQIVATVASAAIVALTGDGTFSDVELINIANAGVAAFGVLYVGDATTSPIAKTVVAALSAVLTLLVNLVADGVTLSEWLQLVVAALGALGVYAFANRPATTSPVTPSA